ncbi:GHMP family kinase ATP-binding protein, partial [Streptomyces corynorhini]
MPGGPRDGRPGGAARGRAPLSSTVPTGAGLSSSAALEVVTALALDDLYEPALPAPEPAV